MSIATRSRGPGARRVNALAQKLTELRKVLGDALKKAPRVGSTGERSFAAMAESVKDLARISRRARYSRRPCGTRGTKLMEAKVCEEDLITLISSHSSASASIRDRLLSRP